MLDLAHQGHMGIIKTKRLIRSKVWFPKIDLKVEEKIKGCLACQVNLNNSHKMTPLEPSIMPNAPWEELSIDFYGPIVPADEYLVVLIDDYSRFQIHFH